MEIQTIVQKILAGDRVTIAKTITLLESKLEIDNARGSQILDLLTGGNKVACKIGISGTPGVGKSTFIEHLGLTILKHHKNSRIAVLAIDPSSPVTTGSILGDKTRMQQLCTLDNVFIRPSPQGSEVGGVADKTRDVSMLMEAAGFDYIIIETVGVGQAEYAVASMVDIFLCLQHPLAGDYLQGMKKGINELADIIAINKSDGELSQKAQQLRQNIENSFYGKKNKPLVINISCRESQGITQVLDYIHSYLHTQKKTGRFNTKREQQRLTWIKNFCEKSILATVLNNHQFRKFYHDIQSEFLHQKISITTVALRLKSFLHALIG